MFPLPLNSPSWGAPVGSRIFSNFFLCRKSYMNFRKRITQTRRAGLRWWSEEKLLTSSQWRASDMITRGDLLWFWFNHVWMRNWATIWRRDEFCFLAGFVVSVKPVLCAVFDVIPFIGPSIMIYVGLIGVPFTRLLMTIDFGDLCGWLLLG